MGAPPPAVLGLIRKPRAAAGRLRGVTVVETILVYAVAPLAVVAVLALLTLVPGRPKKTRYKPGQPWEHEPVWYEPHPVGGGGHGPTEAHGPGAPGQSGAYGGGDSHGATSVRALTAGPSAAAAARPFGGARGTW